MVDQRNRLGGTLSGGMKRRLNIALALVHEPLVLILDEPQAGLDPQSRVLVREYVRALADVTVILTTDDMEEADRMADRVAILDHGQLLVLDTADNLKSSAGSGDVLGVGVVEGRKGSSSRSKKAARRGLGQGLRQRNPAPGGGDILNSLPALYEKFRVHGLTVEDMVIRKTSLEDVFIGLTGRRVRE